MLYEADLTIPANTPKSAPAELEVPVVPGTVSLIQVQIPFGCRSMVHSIIRHGHFRVWPTGPDQTFKGNDALITWYEDYDLTDEPLFFTVAGWSPDTVFPHTITFRFALLSLALKEAAAEQLSLLQRIKRALIGAS